MRLNKPASDRPNFFHKRPSATLLLVGCFVVWVNVIQNRQQKNLLPSEPNKPAAASLRALTLQELNSENLDLKDNGREKQHDDQVLLEDLEATKKEIEYLKKKLASAGKKKEELELYLQITNNTHSLLRTTKQPDPSQQPNATTVTHQATNNATINATDQMNWKKYRLGDWVLGKGKGPTMTKDHGKRNDTLAWEYALEIDRRSNGTFVKKKSNGEIVRPVKYVREAFCNLVQKRGKALLNESLPQPGDLVLHLRLGDTLDEMMQLDEAEDAFEYGVSIVPSQIRTMVNQGQTLGWWHYVKSKCYYENVLQELENNMEQATSQKRVIIVGSPVHQKKAANNLVSVKFTELVQQFFLDRGYEVQTRLDGLPDDDMVWMSHAPVFVAAGGGFSKLVSDCVDYLGGLALRPDLGSSLEESCWTAPKPDILAKNYSWETAGWHGKTKWNGIKSYPPEETIWT